MFRFYWPWFALLFPLPILARMLLPSAKIPEKEPLRLRFPSLKRVQEAFPVYKASNKSKNSIHLYLLSFAWVFLVFALMRPERVDQFTRINNKGYDLMLAVDISASMQALDFSTSTQTINRLDVTKDVVGKFVRGRQGDRVGLVTFGENAYLYVPPTMDTLSVGKMLDDVVPGMAGNATAIGDAIGLSVRTLRERPEGSRVLMLLTDGEDNASSVPPIEAAKLAAQYGIKIYTIGVGTTGAVPFPTRYGGVGMAKVSIDENLLKEIATITDGQYFHANDKKALAAIYDKIDALEKTEVEESIYLIREPLYRYPLVLGMLCLLFILVPQLYWRAANVF